MLVTLTSVCDLLTRRHALLLLTSRHVSTVVDAVVQAVVHPRPGQAGRAAPQARSEVHILIGAIGIYCSGVSCKAWALAMQGAHAGSALGSAALRELLAQPLLQLLRSKALDLLARMPHARIPRGPAIDPEALKGGQPTADLGPSRLSSALQVRGSRSLSVQGFRVLGPFSEPRTGAGLGASAKAPPPAVKIRLVK
jgi:hypothetical protein